MKTFAKNILWVFLAAATSCVLHVHVREAPVNNLSVRRTGPTQLHNDTNITAVSTSIPKDPLALSFGDLPGYTGWARPTRSTVAWYQATRQTPEIAMVGVPIVWMLHCQHADCRSMEALFDTRAYGPSIIPGSVKSHHNGSYSVTMIFHDPGEYVVEVVLAFSDVAPLETFPVSADEYQPAYEGYLLPGFPVTIQVVSNDTVPTRDQQPRPACTSLHLYESDMASALHKGRWKVTNRARGWGNVPNPSSLPTLTEYQYGMGSIGFQADYVYHDCDLASMAYLKNQSIHLFDKSRTVIVFIGDSHMRKQHKLFDELFRKVLTSVYLKTNDGLLVRLPEIQTVLQTLTNDYHAGRLDNIFIIFNAGLHEVDVLCSKERARGRQRVISIPDANFSCTEQYRSNLIQLTRLVLNVPSALRVFQSTSAGWLRWGNYGFAWNPTKIQYYPEAPQACADLNAIAYDVMQNNAIPVVDSFWKTLSRRDHRETDKSNTRGKKMVHAGEEVNEVLLREWLSLVLQTALNKNTTRTM